MLDAMPGWQRAGWCSLVGLCLAGGLAGCLAAPSGGGGDGPPGDDGGPGTGDDGGASGIDAATPVCGDGTGFAIAHMVEIHVPSLADSHPMDGPAVFMNTGTTTIHTEEIRIDSISTIGSAELLVGIADGVGDMQPGESHGFLDSTSRPLMIELVEGFWRDQGKPRVFGSISHSITSGTFGGTVVYKLGEYQVSADITFLVGGESGATAGAVIEATCDS